MVEQVKTKTEPYVRFRGFTDEWEEVKVSSLSSETYGGGTPKTKISEYWAGNIPWLQSSDISLDDMYGVKPSKFITHDAVNNSSAKIVPKNSIAVVTRVGVGKLAFIPYDYATSQDFLSLSNMRSDSTFTLYSLYKLLDKEVANIQGTSIKGLTKTYFLSRQVTIPTDIIEQQKIGDLFQTLDNVIDLSNTQVESLKQQKKALLQYLIPQKGETEPKVRLRGFTDEWEQVKLGDVLNYSQPTKYIVESDNYDDSFTTPVLTAGKSFLLGYTDETDGIYDKGDVILFDDFTTATQLVDFEFKVKSSAMKLLTPIGDNNINFLYETLNLIRYPHDDHKRYWISEYASLKVKVPCDNDEQQAIGELFQTLDEQISQAEDKVSQHKELKHALLQRLFV